jgi:thiamine-phosphate pyrophosphorylase
MATSLILPPVYPILDTDSLERLNFGVLEAAEALLEGGAQILQFRHKAFWSRETFAQAEQIACLCARAGVLFVVNDRADYAAILARQINLRIGLHIGQDDLSPRDARTVVGQETVLGFSTHNFDQMRDAQAEDVDYVAFGPVFATGSKQRADPTVGIGVLRAVRALTTRPLVAIGGITRDNASICWGAGANSVAIIADLLPEPCTKQMLRDRMTEWLQLNPK